MMGSFPDEMSFVIVDDLYLHYDVMYDDREELVYVECNHCEDIVAMLSYNDILPMDEMDLYEKIIEAHRKI